MTTKVLLLVLLVHGTCANFSDDMERLFGNIMESLSPDPHKNFVASPKSIIHHLVALSRGSNGTTLATMSSALTTAKYDPKHTDWLFHSFVLSVSNQFVTTQKIFLTSAVPLLEQYRNLTKDRYDIDVENIDFGYEAVAELINIKCREVSDDYTIRTVKPEELNANTSLIVINGLVHQAVLNSPFPPQLTAFKPFRRYDGNVEVLMMNNPNGKYGYVDAKQYQLEILTLIFDKYTQLWIVLPYPGVNVDTVPSLIKELAHIYPEPKLIDATVPKFQIDNLMDITPILHSLDLNRITDPSTADFTGIGGKPGEIYLNKFMHKTEIRLNEAGLQQYPLKTDVEVGYETPEASFIADRPFYFLLRNGRSFVLGGKVVDPTVMT